MRATDNHRLPDERVTASDAAVEKPRIALRRARPGEARLLAEMMLEEAPKARLGRLGLPFNTRLHHRFIVSPLAVTVVAEVDGEVEGHGTGLIDTRRFHREFVLKAGLVAGLLAAPYLVRPKVLSTVIGAFRYFPQAPGGDPAAELVALNVRTSSQRLGLGTLIFEALMDEFRALGISEVKLGHIPVDMKQAIGFWESLGSRLIRTEELYPGYRVRVYFYDIPERGTTEQGMVSA